MREIQTGNIRDFVSITVPGSKSYSHRIAIAAALADGTSTVYNMLDSDDIQHTISVLEQLGAGIQTEGNRLLITGCPDGFAPCDAPIYVGNSGTTMRLMTAVAALGEGRYRLYGTDRMHERPIGELLAALSQLGIDAVSVNGNGCPPVEIGGGRVAAGRADLDCSVSSQYLSAILLIAPLTEQGIEINVTRGPVSKPYVDMTVDIMTRFGIDIYRNGHTWFHVPGKQTYQAGSYTVEPDCSQAGYFWAAAAVTGAAVKVTGISKHSAQGDVRFVDVLESMGCRVRHEPDGITVTGGKLNAVSVDMGDMPDLVPTLSVVAAFAEGITEIRNVAHLAAKESDRLAAVTNELTRMGIHVVKTTEGLRITGGTPYGAEIETYDDHRIAMSFAVAGLMVPGVVIRDENCVEKSFPDFWDVFSGLYR